MQRLFKILFLLFLCKASIAQLSPEYVNCRWVADSLKRKGNYLLAAIEYKKICSMPDVQRGDYYTTSSCYCKLGKSDSALHYLNIGADQGMIFWGGARDIDGDTNISPLKKLEGWPTTRATLIKNYEETDQNDSLRKVLDALSKKDQHIRYLVSDSGKNLSKDSLNKVWVKIDKDDEIELNKIIEKFGWPGFKLVGLEGEDASWLIAQHSDLDTVFQEKCLHLLEQAVKKRDAYTFHLAYLQDRVLVNQKKKQIYGTQFRPRDTPEGIKLVPLPIEEAQNLNKRRNAVGLGTLEQYIIDSMKYCGYTK